MVWRLSLPVGSLLNLDRTNGLSMSLVCCISPSRLPIFIPSQLSNTVSENFKGLEHLGAAHSSDLVGPFSGGVMADYFIQFITHLDSNDQSASRHSILPRPRYANELPSVMRVFHNGILVSIGQDDYREALDSWNRLTLGLVPPP